MLKGLFRLSQRMVETVVTQKDDLRFTFRKKRPIAKTLFGLEVEIMGGLEKSDEIPDCQVTHCLTILKHHHLATHDDAQWHFSICQVFTSGCYLGNDPAHRDDSLLILKPCCV